MKFDIADLWIAVQSEGGSLSVSENRRWAAVSRSFSRPPTMTNLSLRLKQLYIEHLLEYEHVSHSALNAKILLSIVVHQFQSCNAIPKGRLEKSMLEKELEITYVGERCATCAGFAEIEETASTLADHV